MDTCDHYGHADEEHDTVECIPTSVYSHHDRLALLIPASKSIISSVRATKSPLEGSLHSIFIDVILQLSAKFGPF